jgi:hypothetical protein
MAPEVVAVLEGKGESYSEQADGANSLELCESITTVADLCSH